MADIKGKTKVIDIGAIAHSGGASWAVTHFLPVYDPSIDSSIKEAENSENPESLPYKALSLDNLGKDDGYCRFDGAGSPIAMSGMDSSLEMIKGQKLFNVSNDDLSNYSYKIKKNCVPFAEFENETTRHTIGNVNQLGLSYYNSIVKTDTGEEIAMPKVSDDQECFFCADSESYNFDKSGRTISLNDNAEFKVSKSKDFIGFEDVRFDWNVHLWKTCNYYAEVDPLDSKTVKGTVSCRLELPSSRGEIVFNKFLFFIQSKDSRSEIIGNPPMLFAVAAFNNKYHLAANRQQLTSGSNAIMNAFECVVTLKYRLSEDDLINGLTLNENQWVEYIVPLTSVPENSRVDRHGPLKEVTSFEDSESINTRLYTDFRKKHGFAQWYDGDVGIGIEDPFYLGARLQIMERSASGNPVIDPKDKTRDVDFFKGLYAHLRFNDKRHDIGFEFHYMDALLSETDFDNSKAWGTLSITPTDKLVVSGVSMFRGAYALGEHGSIAFGEDSLAKGDNAISIGWKSKSKHHNNISIGYDNSADAFFGMAIGHESVVGAMKRHPDVKGYSNSASYAIGHQTRSDSGFAAGVNSEARGFWYSPFKLDATDSVSTTPDGTLAENAVPAKPHDHTCNCPICRDAIGHLMLAAEYDCKPELQNTINDIITRQFGNLFSYAIGKSTLSAAMSGAIGIGVETIGYSALSTGLNIKNSHYYSTVMGSNVSMLGSSNSNLVFAKMANVGKFNGVEYTGNNGNTIVGQEIDIARMSQSLVFAYGIRLTENRGILTNCLINSINSTYVNSDSAVSKWVSPCFIDVGIKNVIRMIAMDYETGNKYNGINIGMHSDIHTSTINLGVDNCDRLHSDSTIAVSNSVLVGRNVYGVRLHGFGSNIDMSQGVAIGDSLYSAIDKTSKLGNNAHGVLIGRNLWALGGIVIGDNSKRIKNYHSKSGANEYYFNRDSSFDSDPINGFYPVLTIAAGHAAGKDSEGWHALELGVMAGKNTTNLNLVTHYDKQYAYSATYDNQRYTNHERIKFDEGDKFAMWNFSPAGTALPTPNQIWNAGYKSPFTDYLEQGGSFMYLDEMSGVLMYAKNSSIYKNEEDFTLRNTVGLSLGGNDTYERIPFHGAYARNWADVNRNSESPEPNFASISNILWVWLRELVGSTSNSGEMDGSKTLRDFVHQFEKYREKNVNLYDIGKDWEIPKRSDGLGALFNFAILVRAFTQNDTIWLKLFEASLKPKRDWSKVANANGSVMSFESKTDLTPPTPTGSSQNDSTTLDLEIDSNYKTSGSFITLVVDSAKKVVSLKVVDIIIPTIDAHLTICRFDEQYAPTSSVLLPLTCTGLTGNSSTLSFAVDGYGTVSVTTQDLQQFRNNNANNLGTLKLCGQVDWVLK